MCLIRSLSAMWPAPPTCSALLGADFAKARIQAEAEARAAKSGEVTLAEIYARPCLAGYDPAAECAAEIACAVRQPAGAESRPQPCMPQGKRLYYISDMYLPQGRSWTPCCAKLRLRLFSMAASSPADLRRAEAQRQAVPPVSAKNADAGKRGPFYWRQLAGGCCRFGAGRHPPLAPSHAGGPEGKPACRCGGGFRRKPLAGHRIRGRAPWLCHCWGRWL